MTGELTEERDRAARCATALGRALARPNAFSSDTGTGDGDKIDRLWINRPGQNRLETAVLAALFFFTVSGFCLAWLTVKWGWVTGLLLGVPAAFLVSHGVALSCAALAAVVRAMGLRYPGTDSDLTGAIVLVAVTAGCAVAAIEGMFLWPAWALPWLIAAAINAVAWIVSCLMNLFRSL